MKDVFYKGKSKEELLAELGSTAQYGSEVYDGQKTAIYVQCTEEIKKSINSLSATLKNNTISNDKLSNRVLWLNIILGFITLIGTIFGVLGFYFQIKP